MAFVLDFGYPPRLLCARIYSVMVLQMSYDVSWHPCTVAIQDRPVCVFPFASESSMKESCSCSLERDGLLEIGSFCMTKLNKENIHNAKASPDNKLKRREEEEVFLFYLLTFPSLWLMSSYSQSFISQQSQTVNRWWNSGFEYSFQCAVYAPGNNVRLRFY